MQAYATAEPISRTPALRAVPSNPQTRPVHEVEALRNRFVDELLGQLADLIADRVAARITADERGQDGWLDTRGAAAYLGVHRDTIRRLAAESVLPAQQAGAGCKLYFRRRDLDDWRSSNGVSVDSIASMPGRSLR
jgi:excisionase family DNA binding protein